MKLNITLPLLFCLVSVVLGGMVKMKSEDELKKNLDNDLENNDGMTLEERTSGCKTWKCYAKYWFKKALYWRGESHLWQNTANHWYDKYWASKKENKRLTFLLELAYGKVSLTPPSDSNLKIIKNQVRNIFNNDETFGAKSIRLSFHDCVGFNCDGCLDLSNPSNFGLDTVVEQLDEVMKLEWVYKSLSRADLWAYAGKWSVQFSIEKNNRLCSSSNTALPFCPQMSDESIMVKQGRKDCGPWANVKRPNDSFPSSTLKLDQIFDFFQTRFQMTDRENVVALLGGAHALGGAKFENSEYSGAFRVAKDGSRWRGFNNGLFHRLLNTGLNYIVFANLPDHETNKKFQFNLTDNMNERIGMLLQSDVRLAHNINGNATTPTTCNINENGPGEPGNPCPESETIDLVRKFARDTEEDINNFVEKFSKGFTQMISAGLPHMPDMPDMSGDEMPDMPDMSGDDMSGDDMSDMPVMN